jgi:hypothetical protein
MPLLAYLHTLAHDTMGLSSHIHMVEWMGVWWECDGS